MSSTEEHQATFVPPGPGQWALGIHTPRPFTAMIAAIHPGAFATGFANGFARIGAPLRTIDERVVNGMPYARPVPLVDRPGSKPPPGAVLKVLTRLHPELRRRNRQAAATLAHDGWRHWVDRWHEHDVAMWTDRHQRLQAVDVDAIAPADLCGHIDAAVAGFTRALVAHFELAPVLSLPIGRLMVDGFERWGLTPEELAPTLEGASPATTEAISNLQPVREALAGRQIASLDGIGAISTTAGALFDDWLATHGWWILTGYDLDALTIGEVPTAIVSAINTPLPEPGCARQQIEAVSERVPRQERAELESLIQAARVGHGLRDAIAPCTGLWPGGLVRRAALAAGRRAGFDDPRLATESTRDELVQLVLGQAGRPTEDQLAERRQRRYALHLDEVPQALGPPEPEPPLDAMPKSLAAVARIGLAAFALETPERSGNDTADPTVIRGQGIGTGRIVGRARIIVEPRFDEQIEEGDILVAPCTTPSWSLLLARVGGLVVEEGGIVAHAAIVSRELGIPAVVGATRACTHIPDRATIEIDAAAGIVRIHRSHNPEEQQ